MVITKVRESTKSQENCSGGWPVSTVGRCDTISFTHGFSGLQSLVMCVCTRRDRNEDPTRNGSDFSKSKLEPGRIDSKAFCWCQSYPHRCIPRHHPEIWADSLNFFCEVATRSAVTYRHHNSTFSPSRLTYTQLPSLLVKISLEHFQKWYRPCSA